MAQRWLVVSFAIVGLVASWSLRAQEKAGPARLVVEPTELRLEVGETATLTATALDEDGAPVDTPIVFYSRARRYVGVDAAGTVEAYRPGDHVVVVVVPKDPADVRRRPEPLLQVEIPVHVPPPPVETVRFRDPPERLYAGTLVPLAVDVVDRSGARRTDVPVGYESRTPNVARVDALGNLELLAVGRAEIVARAEAATATLAVDVVADPVTSFELRASATEARTGDVVWVEAIARDAAGDVVADYPVQFAVSGRPLETILAPGATAHVEPDGAFVAERSGAYTVVAVAGRHTARCHIDVRPRDVRRPIELVGHGPVRDRHTSDLWVWEAPDGRDYAITGTWGAAGHAYVWDVTDPSRIEMVDMVRVDARTVNDVKVSEDGRIAVISREGASNRKNGFVILDVSHPRDGVRVLSRYDDQLHGGVHNVFIHKNHVYAINNGRRFDIINIEDPLHPQRVGRFELTTPGHGIHDVWVVDGIAYSSNWVDGVVAVDVGGGGKGGAPNNPVLLGQYAYPSGWNHAAFPYRSRSTGKFYVFAGDEAFPYGGIHPQEGSPPDRAAGWIHVIEWEDWESPREVARYLVPEAGTHNLWIEDDIMYVGYYNGGLRVVDVSGELRGDLYKQGREIGFFVPYDPKGYIPNAPFTWGAQPYKGNIFFADFNSGLWAVRLGEPDPKKKLFLGEPH